MGALGSVIVLVRNNKKKVSDGLVFKVGLRLPEATVPAAGD